MIEADLLCRVVDFLLSMAQLILSILFLAAAQPSSWSRPVHDFIVLIGHILLLSNLRLPSELTSRHRCLKISSWNVQVRVWKVTNLGILDYTNDLKPASFSKRQFAQLVQVYIQHKLAAKSTNWLGNWMISELKWSCGTSRSFWAERLTIQFKSHSDSRHSLATLLSPGTVNHNIKDTNGRPFT